MSKARLSPPDNLRPHRKASPLLSKNSRSPPGTKTGLETGTTSFFVSRLLALHQLQPIVIDAHEVRKKARRKHQKCDSRDAEEICHGIRTEMYRSIVHVPPKTISLIREALKRRRFFVRSKSKQIVAVKSLLEPPGSRSRQLSSKPKHRGPSS